MQFCYRREVEPPGKDRRRPVFNSLLCVPAGGSLSSTWVVFDGILCVVRAAQPKPAEQNTAAAKLRPGPSGHTTRVLRGGRAGPPWALGGAEPEGFVRSPGQITVATPSSAAQTSETRLCVRARLVAATRAAPLPVTSAVCGTLCEISCSLKTLKSHRRKAR